MATAVGMEASPATDASWEGGGSGGDDGIKQAFPEPESSPQNGGDGVLSIAEPGGGGGGTAPEETAAAKASAGLSHAQLPDASEAGAAALLKGPEEPERPVRRSFQIPRKSREKKALFQPLTPSSREFEDVLNILHSSYLEPTSVANFNYKRACLIHNELLEKEFTEKRRELKFDGRLDKELSESYAFLMVDRHQVQSICEKGLQVGQSKITILGSPSMGIYLSRYADLLQANPLEAGAMGDVVIFKIMKGKIKSIYDPMGVKSLESMLNKNTLDPTPKHECHMSKNANRITSLLAYRAYELTQYYFYEYGFDELRRRPRHVCPYAVVSFNYKDDIQTPKFISSSRSNSFNADRNTDKFNYTLWKGQLLNKGKLLCYISLRSATRAFLPIKLPEKLDVETVMSIDHLKQKIPPSLFYKDIYVGPNEVLKNGMYCSLYEVVEKTRVGSNMESLLLKLEKEKLVLVKLLGDRGFLFLLSPCQMISPYEYQTVKSRALHALFLFQEPRSIVPSQKGFTSTVPQERHESVSDVLKITQFLQFSLIQCRKEFKNINSINFHSVVDKYVSEFFKRGFGSGKREFTMFPYDSRLDDKKFLYSAPKNKSHIDDCLHTYIFRPEMYQLPICQLKELFEENRRFQQLSPLSDYEGQEEVNGAKMKFRKRNNSKGEMSTSGKQKSSHSLDYDKDRVKELINLIQCRKKNVGGDSDTEDMKSKAILKRKLEDLPENMRKLAKTSDLSENCHLFEESPQLAGSLSGGLGHDADVRGQQQGTSNSGVADIHRVFDWLSETLANARHSDTPLTDTVNKALGLSIEGASEETRQKQEQELNITQDKKECEQPTCAKIENVHFKDSQSPLLDVDTLSLKYPIAVSTSEGDMDHKLHLKEMMENTCGTRFEECDSVWKVMEKEEEKKKPPGSFDPDTIPAMEMAAVSIRNSPRKEERNARRSSATLPTWGQVKLMSTWAEIALTNTDKPITPENLFLTMITVIPAAPGDPNLINMDNFEDCSLCPSEHGFGRQPSKSNTVEEPEIHWKLIPITGGNARSPEDQLGKQGEKQTPGMKSPEDQLVCLPPQEAFPNDPREYLIKLGNTECHPEQFLERRSELDKLLIIIQNEDIAGFIHKVPGLVMLKKLPCVSFAGVDSLDDVKNHTYNELFVSGGFIVSDESVLNPDVITIENLKIFLTFLEELSTPEGKWQWKVHCKFQKKLKELGRLNTKALSLLTLLNVYQKKHLVEILSYHICDSQTRNAPELDCLIRLQAQNIQQRHIVFLTEKNIKMFSSYADNGIVVATTEDFMQNFKSLVGYHNTNTEENHPILAATENHESQSALLESAEKDEEDMSLDSGDEISQIEVCSNFHSEILAKETKGSRGTEQKKNVHTELQSSPDMHKSLLEDKTYENDFEEQASVDRVCPESDENSHSAEQDLHSNFQLNMSHQFSHFNVLTHQTFLGTPYASRK
ncbi:protein TASOR isoform X17 [Echinops telfairi]|uniref:Protein TASOR isoform X17 n=1 Tax=Echinops telfairi TaxID=9371 RepID=A0AC55D282_ECHTE|nr:protein TASOR isoform X17 [Echinops telfairi]